jgi:Trk-type K+ transport system membrane component
MDDMLSLSDNDSHSKFELMLLPQERQVLNIVKARAERRRNDQEQRRRMWTVAIVVTVFVVVIVILAILYGDLPSMGPG